MSYMEAILVVVLAAILVDSFIDGCIDSHIGGILVAASPSFSESGKPHPHPCTVYFLVNYCYEHSTGMRQTILLSLKPWTSMCIDNMCVLQTRL